MKRNKFSLSHYKLLSCDMGELIPLTWFDVLPGDTVQHACSALVRAAPLLAPVMHPVHVSIRHFYVPLRIIWDDFEDFITGGPDGNNNSTPPYRSEANSVGSLRDYLGVPPSIVAGTHYSALPIRAYQMIWNEYYRDQDLQAEAFLQKTSGVDSTYATLQRVNWEKDYFTSARPWEQKGPSITIPIGTTAPVVTDDTDIQLRADGTPSTDRDLRLLNTGALDVNPAPPATGKARFGANTGLEADLSSASAVTVNLLREAMALQRYEEARARFGSRYTEYLRYLGVRSSDARLQRPEYLGGGRQTLQFSEVLQTAEGTDPVGDLKGHGINVTRSNRYRRFFEEHGIVMSLMHVRPKSIYSNGLHRSFSRETKEAYWQKELQHIGQQEVYNKEVYAAGGTLDGVFGYQDRYDDYRRLPNTVAGEFRTTLNYWHFAREFGSAPALNSGFVTCTPAERSFAVSSADVLYVMAHHSIQARRMVASSGTSYIY